MKKTSLAEWSFYVCILLSVSLLIASFFMEEPKPEETLIYKLGEGARSIKENFNKGYTAKDSVKIDSLKK